MWQIPPSSVRSLLTSHRLKWPLQSQGGSPWLSQACAQAPPALDEMVQTFAHSQAEYGAPAGEGPTEGKPEVPDDFLTHHRRFHKLSLFVSNIC